MSACVCSVCERGFDVLLCVFARAYVCVCVCVRVQDVCVCVCVCVFCVCCVNVFFVLLHVLASCVRMCVVCVFLHLHNTENNDNKNNK